MHFLRNLADYQIDSITYATQCVTNSNDFKATVVYPSKATINKPVIQILKNGQVNDSIKAEDSVEGSIQTITGFDDIFSEHQYGNYSISKSTDTIGDISNTFTFKENYFCYIPCCLYTNTSETIMINKEDDYRKSFILNLYGTCDDNDLNNKIIRVKQNETKITSDCKVTYNQKNNRHYLLCDLSDDKIPGGKNDDKPIDYNLQFKDNQCDSEKSTFIDTNIIISVVSGYYIFFHKIYVLLLLFFLL